MGGIEVGVGIAVAHDHIGDGVGACPQQSRRDANDLALLTLESLATELQAAVGDHNRPVHSNQHVVDLMIGQHAQPASRYGLQVEIHLQGGIDRLAAQGVGQVHRGMRRALGGLQGRDLK
jgi:hypothetical protein